MDKVVFEIVAIGLLELLGGKTSHAVFIYVKSKRVDSYQQDINAQVKFQTV